MAVAMKTTVVYLLHRDGAMPDCHHARHYIGSAVQLEERLKEHERGGGAPLTQVWVESGAAFHCSRTWKGDRYLERRLKRQKQARRLCPACNPHAFHRMKEAA
jgi:predicted GIY-YIG superfamily endonuclease